MILLDVMGGYIYGVIAATFILPVAVMVILGVLLARFIGGRKKR